MKSNFRLIESPPPPDPPDYCTIYIRMIQRCLQEKNWSKDYKRRIVYLLIKGLPVIFDDVIYPKSERYIQSHELLFDIWLFIGMAEAQMGRLTPNEFMTVFPIKKEYDGQRYGLKDYYSTVAELKKIGMDTPIGENVQSLLFDYQNRHVIYFNVFKITIMDQLRAFQNLPSMVEEFMTDKEIFPMKMMTDKKGRQFMYDPNKQTTFPLVKKFPRYLKLLK